MWQEISENRKHHMQETEKLVLRRRKQQLSEVIEITDVLLAELQRSGLLTDNLILVERCKQARVVKVIDLILSSNKKDAFSRFCDVLSSADYGWLSRDLVADLRIERGDFHPDPQIVDEAAVLVHRKFGTSKRFSETDKKEISEMIALKLQISHSEWIKETEKLRGMLNEELAAKQSREELARSVSKLQKDFVRRHESQLVSHAHDMITTRHIIQRILKDDPMDCDILFQFKENLEKFLRQMASALNQRDALFYEKEKCLRMLGYGDNSKEALDEVISSKTGLMVNPNLEVEDKDAVIRKLRRQVSEIEKQGLVQAKVAKEIRRQVAERDREISKLRHLINIK